MANRWKKKEIDIQRAISLYEKGHTQLDIATVLGVNQGLISERFKDVGYKCRKRNMWVKKAELHPSWKGENVGYKALHYRVKAKRGNPSFCSMCESTIAKCYEWANVTGDYHNTHDYIRLCRKCHFRLDRLNPPKQKSRDLYGTK